MAALTRFMMGLAPVQWSRVSSVSGSQMVSGSRLTPALHSEWKLDQSRGFSFRIFFSNSVAASQNVITKEIVKNPTNLYRHVDFSYKFY